VGYYHSTYVDYIGLHFETDIRLVPELRIGDFFRFERLPVVASVSYQIVDKEDIEFYAGIGVFFIINSQRNFITPVGFNFYPFEKKNFGFHFEAALHYQEESFLINSLGIRYRFLKDAE
jgi:hypothetical protein